MSLRSSLTDEERREWDELRYDAAYYPVDEVRADPLDPGDGLEGAGSDCVARPSHEAKECYLKFLEDAVKAGREWAQKVLDHVQLMGLGSDLGNWKRTRDVVNFPHGSVVTTKPAAMAFRRRRSDGGTEFLSQQWAVCTLQDLRSKLIEADAQRAAGHTTVLMCRSLIRLMKVVPKAGTVGDALDVKKLKSVEEWFVLEAEKNHAAA